MTNLQKKTASRVKTSKKHGHTELAAILGLDKYFCFNWRGVCGNFLNQTFRFSSSLQTSVRTNRFISSKLTVVGESNGELVPFYLETDWFEIERSAVIFFLKSVAENSSDLMRDHTKTRLLFLRTRDVFSLFDEKYG